MTPDDPRHGTNAGYQALCRCTPCRDAKFRAAKARQVLHAGGGQCRYEHDELAALVTPWLRQGLTVSGIANAAGIDCSGLARVWHRKTHVNRSTYEHVAAITEDDFADTAKVNAALTRKRVYSLMAAGHELSSMPLDIRGYWRTREFLWARQARALRAFYQAHEFIPGSNRHTAARAANAGHVPPLAWDDPGTLGWVGVIVAEAPASNTPRRIEPEDVEFVLSHDPLTTARQLADRFGCTPDGIQHACRRAGRDDLLARLARNAGLAARERKEAS